jgi:hypothetical protein
MTSRLERKVGVAVRHVLGREGRRPGTGRRAAGWPGLCEAAPRADKRHAHRPVAGGGQHQGGAVRVLLGRLWNVGYSGRAKAVAGLASVPDVNAVCQLTPERIDPVFQ